MSHGEAEVNVPDGRAIGLDLGTERVGVAISNDERTVATPLEVVPGRDWVALDHRLAEIVDEWEVQIVVVGAPISLDGSEGPAMKRTKKSIARLRATLRPPIVTYDERLTTVTAHSMLDEQGVPGRSRRDMVDMLAAQVILQNWIDGEAHD